MDELQSELESRQEDYAGSMLEIRSKFDEKREKWGLKLLEMEKTLHEFKQQA